ncbi:sensor histidine kinase [Streptomyces sp. NBC_00691]|uniref:sensor histidine kinase n=1 Tax=Streptomyces sp. NBC_00691 TaxID=2903671 RepID=UPI002E2F574F|nr:nitrate- and nitrite sensing domain-containing protein [Streptomyces sp. NBC_00691]
MRTPRRTNDAEAPAPPSAAARGRRAHAGPPADEPGEPTPEGFPGAGHPASAGHPPASAGHGPDAGHRPASAGHGDDAGHVAGTGRVPGRTAALGRSAAPGDHVAPHGRPSSPHAAAGHGAGVPRHGLRPRTVRAKIVSLLMVPVVSLLALWGFATVTTAQDVARLRQLQRVDAEIREPVTAALAALQAERRAAVRQTAAPGATRAAELKDRMRRMDEAVDRLRLDETHTVGDTGDLPGDVGERVSAFVGKVEGLARLRTAASDGHADGNQVYEEYTAAVSAAFAVGGALAGIQDAQQGSDARVLLEFGRAGEMLSREDALLTAAHLTGRFSEEGLRAFSGAVETRRTLTASATADLPAAARAAWDRLAVGGDHTRLTRAEDRIRAESPGRAAAQAVPSADWDDTLAAVRSGLTAIETDARAAATDRSDPFAGGVLTAAGAAVNLGLAAVAASLVISVRIGRGLVVELVSLRNTALGIARGKLPAAMRRLRAGEEIDVEAETPPGPVSQDEIGQVGEALTTVHRAALSAAVERAELASGISGVFVNLARRSQVLVHRQLNLLDSMERRADDPNELGDLFRLDHLTTRMRRHAESLIILSGAAPGRAWRMPVPLTNVVRAAVSEIEDYARVEVRRLPETAVVGGAVADLTHLLAELIENAAQFSPPHTKVRVSGEPVGNGYALEIEDRGLGMGKETLAEANARIAQSEALDLFDSDRLGLFVVSRLSSRHDIKVQLRTSPYGGTTAVVLLPTDLLQGALPPGRSAAASGGGTDTPPAGTPQARDPRTPAPDRGEPGADHRQSGDDRTTGDRFGPDGIGSHRLGSDRRTDDARAAREREEAQRAEARRFGRPPVPRPPAQAGPPTQAPTLGGGTPTGPVPAPRGSAPQPPGGARPGILPRETGGARPPVPPQPPAPTRPQSLPRPTVVPALTAPTEPGPPPSGVTELRRRGPSVPPARQQQPGTPAGATGPAGAAEHAGHGDDADGELPRRVRQASLVPQLREAPPSAPVFVPADPGTDARTPEVVRDRMAAYRDGWRRGGGAAPGSRRPLGTGTGHEPGHGTTPLDAPRPEGDQR